MILVLGGGGAYNVGSLLDGNTLHRDSYKYPKYMYLHQWWLNIEKVSWRYFVTEKSVI